MTQTKQRKLTVQEMVNDPVAFVRHYRLLDTDPEVVEVVSDLQACWCCGKEVVGVVKYTTSCDNRRKVWTLSVGDKALFVGRICTLCESKFTRNKLPTLKSEVERLHDQQYRKFLQHKLYPEVVCEFTDGKGFTAKTRLKHGSKMFKVK